MARIARIAAWLHEAPIASPVVTSFGRMTARQALLVRIEDDGGGWGWGEVGCNFPPSAGANRLRLLEQVVGPWLLGREAADPRECLLAGMAAFRVLAIQCGEPGPFAHVLAGIDVALWDLNARRQGVPVAALAGPAGARPVPAYASGINPDRPERVVERARAAGFRTFKLKTGFAEDRDNLARLRAMLAPGERLAIDFNQALDLASARRRLPELAPFDLLWIEEPIAADAPLESFCELARLAPAPLAGGENVTRLADFRALIDTAALRVVQPDVARWGGVSLAREIARRTIARGSRYCPHFLGGGVGLLASAQLLAGIGGDGLLEVDVNENPLRDLLVPGLVPGADGLVHLPAGPGLGAEPALEECRRWRTGEIELR
jgi:L-alanine-DL-glutamate epimerase-like enolase superfamily enzyme